MLACSCLACARAWRTDASEPSTLSRGATRTEESRVSSRDHLLGWGSSAEEVGVPHGAEPAAEQRLQHRQVVPARRARVEHARAVA